jgi:hypothetical protein
MKRHGTGKAWATGRRVNHCIIPLSHVYQELALLHLAIKHVLVTAPVTSSCKGKPLTVEPLPIAHRTWSCCATAAATCWPLLA